MSNLKPCKDPRICGVRNHRPGTACRAEGMYPGTPKPSSLGSGTVPSSATDITSSVTIARTISEQDGWLADDFDEWQGGFYAATLPVENVGKHLQERGGFSDSDMERARDEVVIGTVVHNPNRSVDNVGLSILNEDEGMIDLPEEDLPDYVRKADGDPYMDQYTCDPHDLPRAMEWLKNEGVPAAIQLRLERDYPRQDAPSAESIQATMNSVDGWDHSAERDFLGRYGSLGKTRSVRQHLPGDWVDSPVPGYGDDYLREYKVTPSAEHNSKSRVHRGMSFAFLDESDKSVSLQPEDLPPYVTPTTRYQGEVLSFTAPASRIAETMEWMNNQGSEIAAKRRAQYLAENYTPEQEARRVRRQQEDPNPDTIWTI